MELIIRNRNEALDLLIYGEACHKILNYNFSNTISFHKDVELRLFNDNHIKILSQIYPFDLLSIRRLWKNNNYCSMIRLENTLREVINYDK
jgi:hypothetical protein